MLISPPLYDPSMPGLALPCLTAALRNRGHEVISRDANVEFFDTILSRKGLQNTLKKIEERQISFEFLGYKPKEMDRLIDKKDFLIEEVENAKELLRHPADFYDYEKYKQSSELIKDCLHFASLPYFRCEISFTNFISAYSDTSTKQILKAVKDDICNPFIDFYKQNILPDIFREAPKAVGISINLQPQVIPGLTLAYLIKQTLKDIHIVIGGSYFSALKDKLETNPMLFSFFDSVIINEGETAITELMNCLEKGTTLSNVPNLIYKNGSLITTNDTIHIEDINTLPAPCFDDLPLHLYFSPQLILPMYMTRGCYWGKCAFCSLCRSNGAKFRIRTAQKVTEDMQKLYQQYGCSTFFYVDEAIPPKDMEYLADEIQKSSLNIDWGTHARFEVQFDENLCKKLANAGCRFLKFGLESASEKILNLMDKGINMNQVKDVLHACNKAGIITLISIFFGFPTETLDDAKETIKFALDNTQIINFIAGGNFVLFKNAKVFLDPEKYEIKDILNNNEDLSLSYQYNVKTGITNEEAVNINSSFTEALKEIMPRTINIFHIFLYSIYYNSSNILWITASKEERLMGEDLFKKKRISAAYEKIAELT